jgi:hypothetical protein
MTPAPTPPTNPANPVPAPAPSPTGEPMVKLPGWLMLICAALVPACTTIAAASVSPEWLKLTAGALGGSAVSLLALTPGWRKPLAMLVLLLAATLPMHAHAQALTVGPSLPAFAITPGAGHPLTLAAGAGFTVGADFFPTTVLNQKTHWLTVGADVFGSLVPVDGKVGGNASLALHVCLLGMFCVGGGAKMLDSGGYGALDGKLDHRSFFILFEPDCRVMKLLWPALASPPPAEAEPREPCDGDHPCAGAGGGSAGASNSD